MIHPFFFYVTRKMDCSQFIHSCVCRDPHSRGVYACHNHSVSLQGRFIPTRVGYTLKEHIDSVYSNGSSPLAWGIPQYGNDPFLNSRFIPTRVGYTSKFQHSERFRPVHPHSRGVYAARKLDFWEAFGSSPLAWGIRSAVLTSTSEFAVHPHSRGVYSAIPVICFNRYTVHPHSRGVYLHQGYLTLSPLRFIPTRVGYTMFWQTVQFRRNGSSPLAWGIQQEP